MSGYIAGRLPRGEHVVYEGKLSLVPLALKTMRMFVVMSLVAGIAWGLTDNVSWAFLVYGIGIVVLALSSIGYIVKYVGTEMVVTNSHIHSKTGIIRVDNDREASLDRIDRVDIDKHRFYQRLFDFGDIEFQTMGSDGDFFSFKDVAHPYEMKDAYNAARMDYEEELRSRQGDITPNGGIGVAPSYSGVERHHGRRQGRHRVHA